MGQKDPSGGPTSRLHPRLEVAVVRREELQRLPPRGHPHPRPHRGQARARGPLEHHDQEGQERGRGQHPHGPARHRDRQVRHRGRRAASRAPPHDRQGRAREHPRDQAPRARREARRAVDRRAAAEPRGVQARDEALAHERDALRREGREGPGLGSPRRLGDGAHRGLLGRPRAAPHPARGHRLRLLRGPHHLRPHRREGLGQQGRDHAVGLQLRPHPDGGARRLPLRVAVATTAGRSRWPWRSWRRSRWRRRWSWRSWRRSRRRRRWSWRSWRRSRRRRWPWRSAAAAAVAVAVAAAVAAAVARAAVGAEVLAAAAGGGGQSSGGGS